MPPDGARYPYKPYAKALKAVELPVRDVLDPAVRLEGEVFEKLVTEVCRLTAPDLAVEPPAPGAMSSVPVLPGERRQKYREHVRTVLAPFVGKLPKVAIEEQIARRTAALLVNAPQRILTLPDFRDGEVWSGLLVEETLPMRVKSGACMSTLISVQVGPYAGLRFRQKMSLRFVKYMLARHLGFPRKGVDHPSDVAGCRVAGLVQTLQGKTRIVQFHVTQSMKDHNRKLLADRATPCYRGYVMECRKCPVGRIGGTKGCYRSPHLREFVFHPCANCGRAAAPFDPALKAAECLACLAAEAAVPKRRDV